MFRAILYHLYKFKNVKNTHGGVLFLKVKLLHGCFSWFLNCINGTNSCKASKNTACGDNVNWKTIKIIRLKIPIVLSERR